jgi:hypothetical protein
MVLVREPSVFLAKTMAQGQLVLDIRKVGTRVDFFVFFAQHARSEKNIAFLGYAFSFGGGFRAESES